MLQWLEALTYLLGILGAAFAVCRFLYNHRKQQIQSNFDTLVKAWTNEGNINGTESVFITLELEDIHGDLIGSLSSNSYNRVLEAHAKVGWFSTKIEISELLGRSSLPVGTVTIKISEGNRLKWRCENQTEADILPKTTELWPSSVGVKR